MLDSVVSVFHSLAETLTEASFYLLVGLLIAGIIKTWVDEKRIIRALGKPDFSSVIKASLIGIPLPLCSCSVVPVALSIRAKGASRGAMVSFLISTPETGVDSIAMTYAMMDPLMTVFRPFAAMTTALTAGAIENTVGQNSGIVNPTSDTNSQRTYTVEQDCQSHECGCSGKASVMPVLSFTEKIKNALRYAFIDLLGDIAVYLVIGLIISGLIAVWIPDDWFSQHPEWLMMGLMLLMGIPLYVCASASTPVAAALIMKGISPGAALVFLLAGPATNIATLTIVSKIMGIRSAVIYVLTIMIAAIGFGLLLNWCYHFLQISPVAILGFAGEMLPESIKILSACIMSCLIGYHFIRKLSKQRI